MQPLNMQHLNIQTLIKLLISSNTISAQSPEFFATQYIEPETNNLIVTCPGASGTMLINGGVITKPQKFTNPTSASSCLTDFYTECQDTGANFNCFGEVIVGVCPAGQMGDLDQCVDTPAGFYRSGGSWADSVKL